MSTTPESTLSSREVELQRRLVSLVERATVDDAAWDNLQERIAGRDPSSPDRRRPRRSQVLVAAAAAIVLVVVGLVALHGRGDGQQVDTIDDDMPRTTIDRDDERPTTTSTTSTTLPPGGVPGDLPLEAETGASGTGTGTGAGPGAGSGPAGDGGATTGGSTPAPGSNPGPSVDPNAAPDGRVPVVTYSLATGSTDTAVRATVWQDADGFHMNVWQTNPWRLYTTWNWGDVPGQNCLAGGTGAIGFPELGYSSAVFSWGLVRSDAASVAVATEADDESRSAVVLGPEVLPGLRPWLARSVGGSDAVSRFRAVGGSGETLHAAVAPAWDARPDTC